MTGISDNITTQPTPNQYLQASSYLLCCLRAQLEIDGHADATIQLSQNSSSRSRLIKDYQLSSSIDTDSKLSLKDDVSNTAKTIAKMFKHFLQASKNPSAATPETQSMLKFALRELHYVRYQLIVLRKLHRLAIAHDTETAICNVSIRSAWLTTRKNLKTLDLSQFESELMLKPYIKINITTVSKENKEIFYRLQEEFNDIANTRKVLYPSGKTKTIDTLLKEAENRFISRKLAIATSSHDLENLSKQPEEWEKFCGRTIVKLEAICTAHQNGQEEVPQLSALIGKLKQNTVPENPVAAATCIHHFFVMLHDELGKLEPTTGKVKLQSLYCQLQQNLNTNSITYFYSRRLKAQHQTQEKINKAYSTLDNECIAYQLHLLKKLKETAPEKSTNQLNQGNLANMSDSDIKEMLIGSSNKSTRWTLNVDPALEEDTVVKNIKCKYIAVTAVRAALYQANKSKYDCLCEFRTKLETKKGIITANRDVHGQRFVDRCSRIFRYTFGSLCNAVCGFFKAESLVGKSKGYRSVDSMSQVLKTTKMDQEITDNIYPLPKAAGTVPNHAATTPLKPQ